MRFKGFKKYNKVPSAITNGTLYTKEVILPYSIEAKRTLRVWLPYDYDNNKRYPVFYFTDGQNLVDKYTTAFGEWEMDDHIYSLQKQNYSGVILVGLDCAKDEELREAEYMDDIGPKSRLFRSDKGYKRLGSDTAEYFVNVIKPLIDNTFKTLPDRDNTGFGGSSMGGLFSLYITTKYNDIFSMCLSYSPAFLLYKRSTLKTYINDIKNKDVKVSFFSGKSGELEKRIYKETKYFIKVLLKMGYTKELVNVIYDKKANHSEASWSKYVEDSLKFLLKK